MAQIEISLARRDDAEPRGTAVEHDAVELIGTREGGDRLHLRPEQALFLLERRIWPADVEAIRWHLEIGRKSDPHPRWVAIDRCGAFDCLRDRLEADPAAGIARQRKAEQAKVEIVLQGRRVDDRHQGRGKHLLALMRQRRGLAAMVVAGQRQHAAIARRARRIGMLQGVDGAIDARTLAVPDAENAIDLCAGEKPDLLAAPDRGCGQILVQARNESNIMLSQERFRTPQRVVVHAERRAAIAGDETGRIEAGGAVAFALQHGKTHQRLDAREIDSLGFKPVFVVQPHLHQGHQLAPSPSGLLGGALDRCGWPVKSMHRQCQYCRHARIAPLTKSLAMTAHGMSKFCQQCPNQQTSDSKLQAEPAEKMEDSQPGHSRMALYTMARRLLEERPRVGEGVWP